VNKLTLLLAALAVCASSSDLQAQKSGSRNTLTVKQNQDGSMARRSGSAARTQTARVSKPVIVEDVQGRRTVGSGGTGVIRNLPSDRPIVGPAGSPNPPYPGGTVAVGPVAPTKPYIRPYRPRTSYSSPYVYGRNYGSYYYPSYYASIYNYSYSPYYYTSGYGYSPYYSGYYPASYYSPYYDSYYGPYYYTSYYSPITGATGGTYAVTGLSGVGSYPVATYPEPIQTNVVDWTPEPTYTDSTRMEAVTPPPAASQIRRQPGQEEMIEYERPIEK